MIDRDYSNMMCLELSNKPEEMPLTLLERWLNMLPNSALTSERIKPTRRPFRQSKDRN